MLLLPVLKSSFIQIGVKTLVIPSREELQWGALVFQFITVVLPEKPLIQATSFVDATGGQQVSELLNCLSPCPAHSNAGMALRESQCDQGNFYPPLGILCTNSKDPSFDFLPLPGVVRLSEVCLSAVPQEIRCHFTLWASLTGTIMLSIFSWRAPLITLTYYKMLPTHMPSTCSFQAAFSLC